MLNVKIFGKVCKRRKCVGVNNSRRTKWTLSLFLFTEYLHRYLFADNGAKTKEKKAVLFYFPHFFLFFFILFYLSQSRHFSKSFVHFRQRTMRTQEQSLSRRRWIDCTYIYSKHWNKNGSCEKKKEVRKMFAIQSLYWFIWIRRYLFSNGNELRFKLDFNRRKTFAPRYRQRMEIRKLEENREIGISVHK